MFNQFLTFDVLVFLINVVGSLECVICICRLGDICFRFVVDWFMGLQSVDFVSNI